MKKNKFYRQGDVFIEAIPSFPKTLKQIARESGRVVLAHGEVTGHHHSICEENVDLFETADEVGVTYLEVKEAMAMLTHQEHSTIELPAGKYKVNIQQEYSPQAIRRVAD